MARYDVETKERVLRMFEERRGTKPEETATASYRHLGEMLGIPVDTMRTWVSRAKIDAGVKPGVTTDERDLIRELRRENAELKRANEILKTASAFFAAAELDRKLR